MLSSPSQVFWVIGGILAALTLIEYVVAVEMSNNLIPLAVIALVKAVLIIHFFMHISRLWKPAGAH